MIYEIQWIVETLLYKNISLILFSKGPQFVVGLRDRWRDIYSERGLLVPYLLPGARGCERLYPHASSVVREVRDASDRLRVPGSTPDSLPLFKSDRVVLITWSPSGYTPVGSDCHDALSSPCLLITTWKLVKAHGVTKNEPKIHVICYITACLTTLKSCDTRRQSACGWLYIYIYLLKLLLVFIVVRKIFSRVTAHKGPLLALLYPWYTNTGPNKKKEKTDS